MQPQHPPQFEQAGMATSHKPRLVLRGQQLLAPPCHPRRRLLHLGPILPPGAGRHCSNRVALPICQPGGAFRTARAGTEVWPRSRRSPCC